jgi:hypothetical protein
MGMPFGCVPSPLREQTYLDGAAHASSRDPSSEFEDGVAVVALEQIEGAEMLSSGRTIHRGAMA